MLHLAGSAAIVVSARVGERVSVRADAVLHEGSGFQKDHHDSGVSPDRS
jgi:hypothetical protein